MICGTPSVRSREGCLAGRSWFGLACDDLRIVGLKLIFLVVTRAVSVLGLSWREAWWKEAGILVLRHQLAVAPRERVRAENPVMAAGLVFGGDRVRAPGNRRWVGVSLQGTGTGLDDHGLVYGP
jgi:hypothetical protein